VKLWGEIKQRRITQIVVTYMAGGWMALAAVDQFVDRALLPPVVYNVGLTLYLFGAAAAFIIGWYHGEKGVQKAPASEILLLALIALGSIGMSAQVIRAGLSPDAAVDLGVDPRRIAVRYFENASSSDELASVADGITEALIERLAEVRSLDVVSKNGVLPYRDMAVRSDSVASALSVGTLIEGSVEQRADRLRITTRLVDGFSGADIERAVLEIPAGEFLVARDSVASTVASLLRERLGEEVRLRELRAGTRSDQAWALAQRAEGLRIEAEDNFDGGGEVTASVAKYRQADSLLALAEAADPAWARPPGDRAHVAYRRAWFAFADNALELASEQIHVGRQHTQRALELNPEDAHALEQRGTLALLGLQLAMALGEDDQSVLDALLAESQADLEAAVEQDPSLATAHAMLSFLFQGMGDNVGAVLSARRALEEDAYLRGAQRIYDRLAWAQYNLEQFRDSRNWCEEGRRRFPGDYRFIECQLWLAATPSAPVDVEGAWALLAQLDSLVPEPIRAYKHGVGAIMVAGVLSRAGLPDSASAVFASIDHSEAVDPQRNLFIYEAGIRSSTGDADGALDVLRRWIAATPGGTLGEGGEAQWWWQGLRGRPEFERFVERQRETDRP
jgi:TolB-like protein